MSWLDKVKDKFIITCGDGVRFEPTWLNAVKEKEFNIARFTFPGVEGELVKRSERLARTYAIEIYFQGAEHLTTASNFDLSSDDKRPWTINHPYYGNLYVQPLGLAFDNTQHNVTKITGTVVETIQEDNPQAVVDYSEAILQSKVFMDSMCSGFYEDVVLKTEDTVSLGETTYNFYTKGRSIIKDTADEEKYTNYYNDAYTAIVDLTQESVDVMRKIQAFINAPFLFNQTVAERQNMMVSQFEVLVASAAGIVDNAVTAKQNLELIAGTLIGAMAAIVTAAKDTDFTNRNEVLQFIDTLGETYAAFLEMMDVIQSSSGGVFGSFIPNGTIGFLLQSLVNFTMANTFNLIHNARQERIVYTDEDSNPILLTHRYYGLNADDSVLDAFIKLNNIGLSEMLFIRKGRKIIYYI